MILRNKFFLINFIIACVALLISVIIADFLAARFVRFPENLKKWDHLNTSGNFDENEKMYNEKYMYDSQLGYLKKDLIDKSFNQKSDFNILFIGDSVTDFGTFPEKSLDKLKKQYSTINFAILNFGTMGYGLEQERKLLDTVDILDSTDLVILQLHPNDLNGTPVFIKRPDGTFTAYNTREKGIHINQWFFDSSNLYKIFVLKILASKENLPSLQERKHLEIKFQENLEDFVRLTNKKNVPFRLIIFKNMSSDEYAEWTYTATLNAIKNTKITDEAVIDLNKLFQTKYSENAYSEIKSDDGHFNLKGDDLISDEVVRSLGGFLE